MRISTLAICSSNHCLMGVRQLVSICQCYLSDRIIIGKRRGCGLEGKSQSWTLCHLNKIVVLGSRK